MVLARVAGYFSSPAPSSPNAQVLQDEHDANVMSEAAVRESHATINQDQYQNQQQTTPTIMQEIKELEEDLDAARPPYIHVSQIKQSICRSRTEVDASKYRQCSPEDWVAQWVIC